MISKSKIRMNLLWLNRCYNQASTPQASLMYSKLAILELCGWIEESMDDLVMRCGKRCVKSVDLQEIIQKKVIRPNSGFSYDDHFKKMLAQVIGLIQLEKIEKQSNSQIIQNFKAVLNNLKSPRNVVAHTYISGRTPSINAPSYTLQQFNDVYLGLKEIEKILKKLKI